LYSQAGKIYESHFPGSRTLEGFYKEIPANPNVTQAKNQFFDPQMQPVPAFWSEQPIGHDNYVYLSICMGLITRWTIYCSPPEKEGNS
jgi:hypothetical protein